jgi:hypothetical protein
MALERGAKDKAGAILAAFPGPATLHTPTGKRLVLLGTAIVFLMFGLQMLLAPPDFPGANAIAWAITGFFLLGALVSAVMLHPNAGGLTLDREGFEARSLFRRHRYQWGTVSTFSVGQVGPGGTMVMYDDPTEHGKLANWNRQQFGRSSALAETYRLDPEALAELLNAWRERALATRT